MIQKKSLYNTLDIVYNGFNRMAYAKMITKTDALSFNNLNTQSETRYAYDAFGRRTLVQDNSQAAVRTLYDGLTFDVITERQALASGSFARGAGVWGDGNSEAGRYRFIVDEGGADSRTRHIGSERASGGRYTGVRTMLYANGRAVALSLSGADEQTGRAYFGTDTIGSVKSVTGESGELETFYEYDAFGAPASGDFSGGLDIGYAGKQLDARTKLYNYGYRDYAPAEGRFTTVDPIRDGLNWFVYTHNDPVNFVDLWGLAEFARITFTKINSQYDYVMQDAKWGHITLGNSADTVGKYGCKATAIAEIISTILDEKVTPDLIAAFADTKGNLNPDDVLKVMETFGIHAERQTVTKSSTIVDDLQAIAGESTYFLAQMDVGNKIGQHW